MVEEKDHCGYNVVKLIDDDSGETMSLIQYEDILFNTYALKFIDPVKQIQAVKQLPYQDGDIMLCTYPKSGTHWMSNLLSLLLTPPTFEKTAYVVVPNLEHTPHHMIDDLRRPRLLHSHLRFERLPSDHVNNGGKIILTVRNPKDVAASLYHHLINDVAIKCKLSWDAYLKYFVTENMVMGSYFEYLKSWDKVIRSNKTQNILVVYYESLIKNTVNELRTIRDFLGINIDEDKLQHIIDKCSIDKLREFTNNQGYKFVAVDESGASVIYRKGIIGDWKNHFTDSQNKEFNKVMHENLNETLFQFDFGANGDSHSPDE